MDEEKKWKKWKIEIIHELSQQERESIDKKSYRIATLIFWIVFLVLLLIYHKITFPIVGKIVDDIIEYKDLKLFGIILHLAKHSLIFFAAWFVSTIVIMVINSLLVNIFMVKRLEYGSAKKAIIVMVFGLLKILFAIAVFIGIVFLLIKLLKFAWGYEAFRETTWLVVTIIGIILVIIWMCTHEVVRYVWGYEESRTPVIVEVIFFILVILWLDSL